MNCVVAWLREAWPRFIWHMIAVSNARSLLKSSMGETNRLYGALNAKLALLVHSLTIIFYLSMILVNSVPGTIWSCPTFLVARFVTICSSANASPYTKQPVL